MFFEKVYHRITGSSKYKAILIYCWDIIINGIFSSYWVPLICRRWILNLLGGKIEGTIHAGSYIASAKLKIGKCSYINRRCYLDNKTADIVIGRKCSIAYDVKLLTTHHLFDNAEKRGGTVAGKKIEIQDGVWIGAGAILLPGAVVCKGCVIAAGSIVRGICAPNCLYAGIPAKKIKELVV